MASGFGAVRHWQHEAPVVTPPDPALHPTTQSRRE